MTEHRKFGEPLTDVILFRVTAEQKQFIDEFISTRKDRFYSVSQLIWIAINFYMVHERQHGR